MVKPFIICVDDEKVVLDTLSSQIEESHLSNNFQLECAQSGFEALDLIQSLMMDGEAVGVVISDQMMPQMSGDRLLAEVYDLNPDSHNILLTGQARMDSVISAINTARVYRYLTKPWDKIDLIQTIDAAGCSFVKKLQNDEQNRIISRLFEVSTLFNTNNKLDTITNNLIHLILSYSQASAGAIVVTPENSNPLIKRFQRQDDSIFSQDADQFPFQLIETLKITKQIYLNDNVSPYSLGTDLRNDPYFVSHQPKTLIAVPLVYQGRMIGLVYLEHNERYKAFSREILRFLDLLAPTASIALHDVLQYESLADKNQTLTAQKQVIEEKINEITDSIQATVRIQKALMLPEKAIRPHFKDFGLFFQPKDHVSGDFYWFKKVGHTLLLAVGDCTGHGIPGAMISVLGINLLERIVSTDGCTSPNLILKSLDEYLTQALRQVAHEDRLLDGMDIGIIALDTRFLTLDFAGAQRPLVIVHPQAEQEIIKGDRYPIGGNDTIYGEKQFTRNNICLQPGDKIFLFSDGITDQFGGDQQTKKFGLSRLQLLIDEYANSPIRDFVNVLTNEMNNWQGDSPQIDDRILLGFSV
jgi:serine phosphatase RsbU (regulator of sigma subunit)/FixJ family two-component response regulator